MAWQLKARPEDFIVEEIIDDVTEDRWKEKLSRIRGHGAGKEKGRYLWLTMTKRDMDFFRAIGRLASSLGISTRSISYSGTKDRRALTSQTVSILGIDEKDAGRISIPGLELSGFRYRHRHVKLGEHSGNRFRITIRNIGPDEMDGTKKRLDSVRNEGIVNYFGGQRFGSMRKVNDAVGKHIVMGDFKQAVMTFLTSSSVSEPQRTRKARADLRKTGDIIAAAHDFPDALDSERKILSYLGKRPDDYIGAFRRLPLRLLKLFVHAYQSRIWNETANALYAKSREQASVPIIGYRTKLIGDSKQKSIIDGILKSEGIEQGMFRIKEFPRLSSSGSARDLIMRAGNLSYKVEDDDINNGKKKIVLSFDLGKGSYATELVRQIQP